jgi:FKBP-type peptidyl-prolyl cis-trans isomerase 2
LVDEQVPWGWSFQALTWVSVEAQAQADAAQLRLHREAGAADSADGRAVYDLNRSFAGKRLNFAATIRRDDRSSASVRIGVLVLDHDWELTDGDASNRGVTAKRHPGTVRARVGAKGENTWAV